MKTSNKLLVGAIIILLITMSSVLITARIASEDTREESSETQTGLSNEEISIEQAKTIALQRVSGAITDVELKNENGMLLYEVEITENNKETEVLIEAKTGTVLSIESDEEDQEIAPDDLTETGSLITEEQAKQIALNHIGEGGIIEIELERESGIILYSIGIISDQKEVEVEIDAETGEILEVEWEDDED